jgi:hypothetical protein
MKKTNDEIIIAIYQAFEHRKALKRVKLQVLFNTEIKKWYQFWKI